MTNKWNAFGARGSDLRDLFVRLPEMPWLRPPAPIDLAVVERLVGEHLRALTDHVAHLVSRSGTPTAASLRVVTSLDVAGAATWDAAWDNARVVASDAARDAARDSRASWDAIRDVAGDATAAVSRAASRVVVKAISNVIVGDEAWVAGGDAVATAAAGDAAREVAHLATNLPSDPWAPLLRIWAMGLWPVCLGTDGRFVVYVPQGAP